MSKTHLITARLGLGTAQFGMDYGVSNHSGQVPASEVAKILDLAGSNGINTIDTASAYGNAELVLGQSMAERHGFRVVTKTPQFLSDVISPGDGERLKETCLESLRRMNQKALYGLLIHNCEDLLKVSGEHLLAALRELRARRLVRKIGVSVYSESQIDRLLGMFTPDLIQLPLNVFDQRLIWSRRLADLKSLGVEIHARSAFLQGLLLMEPGELPSHLNGVRDHLRAYRQALVAYELTPVQAAIQFALARPEIDTVIVGVCSAEDLAQICEAARQPVCAAFDYRRWRIDDPDILDPSRWRIEESLT